MEDADHSEDAPCADPGTEDADHRPRPNAGLPPESRPTANPCLPSSRSPAPGQSLSSFLRSPAPACSCSSSWPPASPCPASSRKPGPPPIPVLLPPEPRRTAHPGALNPRAHRCVSRALGGQWYSPSPPRAPDGSRRRGEVGRADAAAPTSAPHRTARGLRINVSSRRSASWLPDHRQRAFSPKPRRETGCVCPSPPPPATSARLEPVGKAARPGRHGVGAGHGRCVRSVPGGRPRALGTRFAGASSPRAFKGFIEFSSNILGSGNARVSKTGLPSGGAAGMASRTDSPRGTGPCS
uniref:uncharacterized protein LOC129519521 n=1 Tax=Nyctereutes procyonoides TaxID=34880 RepID=UPI00244385E4|nr:uncharacterized protein LOC129519521 [Nyctereutes procyonoides]